MQRKVAILVLSAAVVAVGSAAWWWSEVSEVRWFLAALVIAVVLLHRVPSAPLTSTQIRMRTAIIPTGLILLSLVGLQLVGDPRLFSWGAVAFLSMSLVDLGMAFYNEQRVEVPGLSTNVR